MSIMSSRLLLLLVCVSMHTCNGRHLGGRGNHKASNRQVHFSGKDVEKAVLDKTLVPSKVKSSLSKERRQGATNMENVIDKSLVGASTQKPKDSDALLNEVKEMKRVIQGVVRIKSLVSIPWHVPHKKQVMELAGREIIMYSDVGLPWTTKIEGSERRARSLIGSGPHVTDESIDSKEIGVVKDVVVMDYEQPHRKPPIHN